jgi:hypothetical protein
VSKREKTDQPLESESETERDRMNGEVAPPRRVEVRRHGEAGRGRSLRLGADSEAEEETVLLLRGQNESLKRELGGVEHEAVLCARRVRESMNCQDLDGPDNEASSGSVEIQQKSNKQGYRSILSGSEV